MSNCAWTEANDEEEEELANALSAAENAMETELSGQVGWNRRTSLPLPAR